MIAAAPEFASPAGMVLFLVVLAVVVVLMVMNTAAAYRNGCVDGYGYSKEPKCPGYRAAGEHLRATMAHRWHELRDPLPTEGKP